MEDNFASDILTADLELLGSSAAILRVAGEIDLSSVHVLKAQFDIAAERGCSELVLDFTGVSFMDSSGIQALVKGRELIHQNGSAVVLVPSRPVHRLLELVSVKPLFDERLDSVDEALSFLGLDEWRESG